MRLVPTRMVLTPLQGRLYEEKGCSDSECRLSLDKGTERPLRTSWFRLFVNGVWCLSWEWMRV